MKARGFTLIEMIISLIIVAVIALGIAGFVDFGTRGFAQTVERQKLHTQAQFVLQRLTREVRHAVPNSLEVFITANGVCLSFFPIKYSGFYNQVGASAPYQLEFIVGQDIDLGQYGENVYLVINPTSQADLLPGGGRIHLKDEAISGSYTSLTRNVPLTSGSVANRHYIFNDTEQTYCYHSTNQTLHLTEIDSLANRIADNITAFDVSYLQADLVRGGLVHISMEVAYNDEVASYQQQVQVLNVP
ncbi:PulJ/GspJ family protein [Vibrio astriarenae]